MGFQQWSLLVIFLVALLSSFQIPYGVTAAEENLYKVLGKY